MSILEEWINPWYLKKENRLQVKSDILSKPYVKYTVLDDFFLESKLEQVIALHLDYTFNEELDRRCESTGSWLPYDAALAALNPKHLLGKLLYSSEWQNYLCELCSFDPEERADTNIKLRYHRPYSDGFWIHTDAVIRKLVAICYFNKEWKLSDGGFLQLWKQDDEADAHYQFINEPKGRMDFLNSNRKISSTSFGGLSEKKLVKLSLLDQILPQFNRLFLCNFEKGESFHSVTPSESRERLGFVQWIL